MFRNSHSEYLDLSSDLIDAKDFRANHLKTLDYLHDVRTFAFDPLAGLLAVGTSSGTVWILGAPGVQKAIKVADHPLRFIEFASSLSKLVCIDETDRLYVWDLSQSGRPPRQASTKFTEPINFLTLSPSHAHAFLVLQSGKIKTYDLLCLRTSPYVMPNMWLEYEKKLSASGELASLDPGCKIPISLTIHPRDLNLIFVCYGGGVILANLKERASVHTYEYVLPAGAPGPVGYSSPDLLKHRRPSATALAVHPTGHFFAVGYSDGSIAFWAVEDEDKPLLVRTLEDIDINVVDGEKLSDILGEEEESTQKSLIDPPEPIFKLSWCSFSNSSDARGGTTALIVLGGGRAGVDFQGLTTLALPAFNPSETPDPKLGPKLSSTMRTAMRDSVMHSDLYTYTTSGVVHDYLLVPRDNPHFAGCFDPIALIILSDTTLGTRSTTLHEFPPPLLDLRPIEGSKVKASDSESITQDLASTLEAMKLADDPRQLVLPSLLWNGSSSITDGDILNPESDQYKAFCGSNDDSEKPTGMIGGSAWSDDTEDESRHAKFEPRRILVTIHRDLTIRFQDLSVQLLVSSDSNPISTAFPRPLPKLTIDLVAVMSDPVVLPKCPPQALQEGSLARVFVTPESLECTIVLKTGDLFVYRFGPEENYSIVTDSELVSLRHIASPLGTQYQPALMIPSTKGPVAAIASSDIGFLAVAYNDGSLMIVDMRGPIVILRETQAQSHRRQSLLKLSGEQVDPITCLEWGVFRTDSDLMPHVRLIAIRTSGHAAVYVIKRDVSGGFSASQQLSHVDGVPVPFPTGSFVLDAKTGTPCIANRSRFSATLQDNPPSKVPDAFWISAGAKGAKCSLNVDGDRISKTEWGSKVGQVENVKIVQRYGAYVLAAFTSKQNILIYSIPHLELMHTLNMSRLSIGPVSVDKTGDYIEWSRNQCGIKQAHLGTLFSLRRQSLYKDPRVDLMVKKKAVPYQPQPVSLGPASLYSQMISYVGGQSTTGDQIDLLLGGPDRPIPEKNPPKGERTLSPASRGPSSSSNVLGDASAGVNDLYSRLGSALSERGQMLDGLEDTVSSLQEGSSNMLAQAKKLALQQSARSWFSLG